MSTHTIGVIFDHDEHVLCSECGEEAALTPMGTCDQCEADLQRQAQNEDRFNERMGI